MIPTEKVNKENLKYKFIGMGQEMGLIVVSEPAYWSIKTLLDSGP
jgi:hypothetical protein